MLILKIQIWTLKFRYYLAISWEMSNHHVANLEDIWILNWWVNTLQWKLNLM